MKKYLELSGGDHRLTQKALMEITKTLTYGIQLDEQKRIGDHDYNEGNLVIPISRQPSTIIDNKTGKDDREILMDLVFIVREAKHEED